MKLRKAVGRMLSHSNEFQAEPFTVLPPPAGLYHIPFATLTDLWTAITCAFEQATQATTRSLDYFYQSSGRVVRLQFAGAALADWLTPALAHVRMTPHPAPALTIRLWDSVSTGVSLPPLPALMQPSAPAHAQWGSYAHSERFHAFWQPRAQLFTMLDSQSQEAIYWVHDTQHLPLTEGGAPLLTLLHWWLGQQGQQVVHSAAVGTNAGGALLVGKSGSGKSTTALACLNAGLYYLGDDYCLVAAKPTPTVYSLYSSGKIHFADLTRFPRLQSAQNANQYADADKALYFLAESFATQLVPSLPLKAVLLPMIKLAGKSQVSAISPAVALLGIAPSTVFQLVGEKQQTIQQLGRLVRQIPCYRLELGPDLDAIPVLIGELLAKA